MRRFNITRVLLDANNAEESIAGHQVAINALDFSSDIPFLFDDACRQATIPILHPYNFGWTGFVTVITPNSQQLSLISETYEGFELKMTEYVTHYYEFLEHPCNVAGRCVAGIQGQ